jgi:hypothetical protein
MHGDLRERVDRAAEDFAQAKRALVRSDGQAKYAPAEFEKLEQAAKNEFNGALNRISDELEGRIASAEQRLQAELHRDPSRVLTSAELSEANSRRAFISDEVFSLGPEAMEQRISAVISAADRPGAFVYAAVIRSRVRDAAYADSPADVANRLTLERLVRDLEALLDPTADARREKLEEEISALTKIRDYAYYRRHGVRDAVEMHFSRVYGSTR